MKRKTRRDIICVVLTVIFAINTVCSTSENALAAGEHAVMSIQQDAAAPALIEENGKELAEAGDDTTDLWDGEEKAPADLGMAGENTAGEDESNQDAVLPSEPENPAEGELPPQPETPIEEELPSEPENPAEGALPPQPETPAEGELPSQPEAPVTGDKPAAGDNQEKEEIPGDDASKETAAPDESEIATTKKDGNEEQGELQPPETPAEDSETAVLPSDTEATIPKEPSNEAVSSPETVTDHSLAAVYWNASITKDNKWQDGNDSNTGATETSPVLTLETALQRTAQNGSVYALGGEYITKDRAVNGRSFNITLNRQDEYNGNLFYINAGSLLLANLTLDAGSSPTVPVITIASGAALVMGEGVKTNDEAKILVKANAKAIKMIGKPPVGASYRLSCAGDFTSQLSAAEEYLLVDAREARIQPGAYFIVEDLPDDWEVYEKDGFQLMLRQKVSVQEGLLKGVADKSAKAAEIYLDTINGNDQKDGQSALDAVATLEKAVELAKEQGTVPCNVYIIGGQAKLSTEKTLTVPKNTSISSYTDKSGSANQGSLLEIAKGTLQIEGTVTGNIALTGNGSLFIDSKSGKAEGTITLAEKSRLELTEGKMLGSVILDGNRAQVQQKGGTLKGSVTIKTGSYQLLGGTVTGTGVAVKGGSFTLTDGTITGCDTAVRVSAGSARIAGGTITESQTKALWVEKDGQVTLTGGEISGNGSQDSWDVHVTGTLHMGGNATVLDVIYLDREENPILLETALAPDQTYALEVAGSLADKEQTLVKGTTQSPASTSNFRLAKGNAKQVNLQNEGTDVVLRAGITNGIYLNGQDGNDDATGASVGQAVKTFDKAKDLLAAQALLGNEGNIIICGFLSPNADVLYELEPDKFPWGPKLLRDPSYIGSFLAVEGVTVTLRNIIFDGNRTEVQASSALVGVQDGTLQIKEGAVLSNNYNNQTNKGGGAIVITDTEGSTKVMLEGGTISNNYAKASGGGIYAESGTIIIKEGIIESNETLNFGGGIFVESYQRTGNLAIEGGTISSNKANGGGGVSFYNDADEAGSKSRLTMTGGNIVNNTAANRGGGLDLCIESGEAVIENGAISDNTAPCGGGIFLYTQENAGILKIKGGNINKNKAVGEDNGSYSIDASGGGIYVEGAPLVLEGGNICENTAKKGGGIFLEGGSRVLSLLGGRVTDNQAQYGAGMYLSGLTGIGTAANVAINGTTLQKEIAFNDIYDVNTILPLRLCAPIESVESRYEIDLSDAPGAKSGAVVVTGDGENVTDASLYINNFSLKAGSGFSLVKKGNDIALGQDYYVNGTDGDDSQDGSTPQKAYRTMEHAITQMGSKAGTIYVCGTVSVSDVKTWTLSPGQSIVRFGGGTFEGIGFPAFAGDLVSIEAMGNLTMDHVILSGGNGLAPAGYLLKQNGSLTVSADSVLENGTVYLKDHKSIQVTGTGSGLMMNIDKENPAAGDVIAIYGDETETNPGNFSLVSSLSSFSLLKDGNRVILSGQRRVYVDGQNGSDTNPGNAPDSAFATIKRAYDALRSKGGNIYVVDTVETAENMELSPVKYQDSNGSVELAAGQVYISRYQQNKNALLLVSAGNLVLSGIQLDGGSFALTSDPLVKVGTNGVLRLKDNAILKNNAASGQGGAIYNDGTVELYACELTNNTASKGAAIYQNGRLTFYDGDVKLGSGEIYLGSEKYIQIEKKLPEGTAYTINMDPADAAAGRTIANFGSDGYDPAQGVLSEAVHFILAPTATQRALTAQGDAALVLAGDYDAVLQNAEFFEQLGTTAVISVVFTGVNAADVEVQITNKGIEIPATIKDDQNKKEIIIPVTKDTIGALAMSFTCQKGTITKTVELSGYEVIYPSGQEKLLAKPQVDGALAIHQDKAEIVIYNGGGEKTFGIGGQSMSYDDGAKVYIDNTAVDREMDAVLAMECFGLELTGMGKVAAGQSLSVQAVLKNGDYLMSQKTGSITLLDASLGGASRDIKLTFQTKPYTRAQVLVKMNELVTGGLDVSLKDEAGTVTKLIDISLTPTSTATLRQRNTDAKAPVVGGWNYRLTGLSPGSYVLSVDGLETGKMVLVEAGDTTTAEVDMYTLQYELNGGTANVSLPEAYVKGRGTELPEPVREGYLFRGWYKDPEFTGTAIKTIFADEKGSYTFYSKWEEVQQEQPPVDEPQPPAEEPQPPTDQPTTPEQPGEKPQPPAIKPTTPVQPGEQPSVGPQPLEQSKNQTPPIVYANTAQGTGANPKTGDPNIVLIDIALIGGMAYLMRLFAQQEDVMPGLTEKQKNSLIKNIIGWAGQKNVLIRAAATMLIFLILLFYYTVGKKEEARELQLSRVEK